MNQIAYLKSSYNRGLIKVKLEVNKKTKSSVVVVFIHGLYGEAGDARSKSIKLGKALESSTRGAVYINTSRAWGLYETSNDRADAFLGKSFEDEQSDVKSAIEMIIEHSLELFGVERGDLQLWIVANSMGGTLVTTIAALYPEIDKIALCGSGITPSSYSLPILSTYPDVEKIQSAAKAFGGDILHLRGGNDDTVNASSQEKLFASFTKARSTRHVVIDGANHNFSKLYGKNKLQAQTLYIESIAEFLQ